MDYKTELIRFLMGRNSLKFDGPYTLKVGRRSPYFFNIGDLAAGTDLTKIGEAYAYVIKESKFNPTHIFGPAYKGIHIAAATAMALGGDVGFVCNRKEEKLRGEATAGDLQKTLLMGKPLDAASRVVIIDDVITTGTTKYEAAEIIRAVAGPNVPLMVVVALDRQEVTPDGKEAVKCLAQTLKCDYVSILKATDLVEFLKAEQPAKMQAVLEYLRVYGVPYVSTPIVRGRAEGHSRQFRPKSIIVACDFKDWPSFEKVVRATLPIPGIGGYKVGALLAIQFGITAVVEAIHKWVKELISDNDRAIRIIYDHQKAGTDIPDLGPDFMEVLKQKAKVDSVILFPQAGPETERSWVWEAQKQQLEVIVGGRMTHAGYSVSEGGWITDEGAARIYAIAAQLGVDQFVVPGNKVEVVKGIQADLQVVGVVDPIFYSPGFIAQTGTIAEAAAAITSPEWHAIIGRGICAAADVTVAATKLVAAIRPELLQKTAKP